MNDTALTQLQEAFPSATCTQVIDTAVLDVQTDDLTTTLTALKENFGCDLLLDVTGIDYLTYPKPPQKERFRVVYTLRNWRDNLVVQVRTGVSNPKIGLPTASSIWESANWGERECWDQYGINFSGHPDLRRILNHVQFEGHPLRKDYPVDKRQVLMESDSLEAPLKARLASKDTGHEAMTELGTDVMFLNIGPAHPATHGAIRFAVALDGETILANVVEIGYLHRGFEKLAEKHTYNQVIPLTDRLNYCSSMMNNIAYVKAIEKFANIEITERAQFMRVVLGEFYRILDHLVCLAAAGVDVGGLTNYWYLYDEKEAAYDFISKLCGGRLMSTATRIGGMYHDFHEGWEKEMEFHLAAIEKGAGDSQGLMEKNRILQDRMQNVCRFSPEQAISFGLTGPNLRSCGVPFDLRKDAPYYNYDAFDFDIPIGSNGDVYDRFMIRYEEIKQSIRIIRQAMKMIPGGPVNVNDPQVHLPKKAQVYTKIEGLANHFKMVFEGVHVPKGEWYDGYEAANGELGFHFVSDGSGTPYKCKVRPPCFYTLGSFPAMVEGSMIADAIVNLSCLNIIGGELDR
ncbi:NADH-quinone oxidoreductase subunit D [Desulforhopalus vacuolatus]|uniref:NADH-quinone oxidoreductase subunit D n=1 Tax=Desulforhopalus vacuolatus TaxID=40414 RepID=UPI001965F22B|nr:NADH-quinone oxidoreductase subunit D [Desulforhopalus vacuolatus]MBM9519480.1 NADH-quinone oxidoreductase subunit D [Desulforhopalus vacuolatus]